MLINYADFKNKAINLLERIQIIRRNQSNESSQIEWIVTTSNFRTHCTVVATIARDAIISQKLTKAMMVWYCDNDLGWDLRISFYDDNDE